MEGASLIGIAGLGWCWVRCVGVENADIWNARLALWRDVSVVKETRIPRFDWSRRLPLVHTRRVLGALCCFLACSFDVLCVTQHAPL
jgi:hypothetical protein